MKVEMWWGGICFSSNVFGNGVKLSGEFARRIEREEVNLFGLSTEFDSTKPGVMWEERVGEGEGPWCYYKSYSCMSFRCVAGEVKNETFNDDGGGFGNVFLACI